MRLWFATQTEQGVWVFTWTPTPGHIYEIWLDGELIHTTAAGVGTYTTEPGDYRDMPPAIELHDTADGDAQSKEYTPRGILQWRGVVGATGYQVEHQRGAVWVPVASATERGAGWYSYNTGMLVDRVAGVFRIKALDSRGLGGTSVVFRMRVTCNPIPPTITGIDAVGGTLTVGVE